MDDETELGRQDLKEDRRDGQEKGAEGDDAEFDVAAGELAGHEGACGDAEGDDEEEIAAAFFGEAEILDSVGDHVELEIGAEHHEVGGGEDGLREIAVLADGPERAPDVADEEGVDFGSGAGGRSAADAEGGDEANERGGDADDLREGVVVAGDLEGEGGEGGARDDGEEGEHDEEAVGAGELGAVHELGDDAVFGGAVEGALKADEEENGVEEEVVLVLEGEDGGEHDDKLEDFAGDEDGAFAVAVGHDAGGGGKDEEGQDEDGGGDGGDGRGGIRAVEADQEEHREELEDVVDEGTAELGDVEAEKIGREAGVVHVWHVEWPL